MIKEAIKIFVEEKLKDSTGLMNKEILKGAYNLFSHILINNYRNEYEKGHISKEELDEKISQLEDSDWLDEDLN